MKVYCMCATHEILVKTRHLILCNQQSNLKHRQYKIAQLIKRLTIETDMAFSLYSMFQIHW